MPLSAKDEGLIRLFMTARFHQWAKLPSLGGRCLDRGSSAAELRGCVRHIAMYGHMTSCMHVSFTAAKGKYMTRLACGSIAGYPLCLKATNTLNEAGILTEQLPGKAGGAPGNAFGLVYERMAGRLWSKLYATDGVVAEWIR